MTGGSDGVGAAPTGSAGPSAAGVTRPGAQAAIPTAAEVAGKTS